MQGAIKSFSRWATEAGLALCSIKLVPCLLSLELEVSLQGFVVVQ